MSQILKTQRYSTIAIALHWAIAILILGQIAGGLFMHKLPNDSSIKFDLYQLHKSFGFSILILTFLRLGWRLGHKPPPLPVEMPAWQKTGARVTHWGFYALMVLTPLIGWAMVSVSPLDIPTKLFGFLPVPHLPFFSGVTDASATEDLFKEIHELLAKAILVLFVLHIAAALKHRFVNNDGVLQSMVPMAARQWISIFVVLGFLSAGAFLYFVAPSPSTQSTVILENSDNTANWEVDYNASQLVFVGSEKDRRFEGEFNDFQVQINFDEDNLTGSSIEVVVGTGSVSTGDTLRDSTIPEKEWFDVDQFPTAVFRASNLRLADSGGFEAIGTLQLKEFTHPVMVTFSLTKNDVGVVAKGGAELTRTDFGLGLNDEWLNDEGVGLDVEIQFEIHAIKLF